MKRMKSKPRYVLDTNVVVSALLSADSVPARAFRLALDHGEILLSDAVAKELNTVLSRPKLETYVTPPEREEFLTSLLQEARLIEVYKELKVCRDPKDDKFLELAWCGKASCIVTGDSDLLALGEYEGIPILSPAEFVRQRKSS
jgi:putative PIN family toxin of toxin-antitoxin system